MMKTVILAGGKGTRLLPYTASFPKPLMPIGDYPILEVIIRQLRRQGFTRVTISTGHLAQLIEAFFGDGSQWGISIDYIREDRPLNTAGALELLGPQDEDFLVMNGDVLTTLDYRALVDEHRSRQASATVATIRREMTIDFGVLEIADDGSLAGWQEKPRFAYDVGVGVYVVSEPARALVKPGEALGMPDLLLRVKEQGGLVHCFQADSEWLDIGRDDDYRRAQEIFSAAESRYLAE
ncbi:MAG: sugar phosphate nucleotidyltransferase [Coriobacteriia bacterium]|nr:sugar phosphate nucleotidyltransferase [Coriobacteriia bacterium]